MGEFTGSLFLRGTEDFVAEGSDEEAQVIIGKVVEGEGLGKTGGWGAERVYRGSTLPYSDTKSCDRP